MKSDRLFAAVFFLLALAYPALVYFGLKRYSPKAVALAMGAVLVVRLVWKRERESKKRLALMLLPPLVLCLISALVNNHEFILYLPVLTSIALFGSFAYTLLHPPSAVETFARMYHKDFIPEEIAHCRRTTQVWTFFFVLNGLIAFWTAHWGSLHAWGLYNGLVTYLVMGVLFTGEFIYRHWRFRRYVGLPTDPLMRKLFPPKI